ncbi:hypothetical protein HKBW3S42_02003, partial [Candidatus Hakubella thermalkaliphila]
MRLDEWYEQRYLEQVCQQCSTLYTEGIDQVAAPLTDVFVMLEAVETLAREMRADMPLTRQQVEEMGLKGRNASGAERGLQEERIWSEVKPSPPVPLSKALQEHQHLAQVPQNPPEKSQFYARFPA